LSREMGSTSAGASVALSAMCAVPFRISGGNPRFG
jgi:hypothetical protein